MSKKDYTPVGGIMTRKNGKKYEVQKARKNMGCNGCAFATKPISFCEPILCVPLCRRDRKEVIFIRRKDLEEPKQAPTDSQ